jgi:hypothetical protein
LKIKRPSKMRVFLAGDNGFETLLTDPETIRLLKNVLLLKNREI